MITFDSFRAEEQQQIARAVAIYDSHTRLAVEQDERKEIKVLPKTQETSNTTIRYVVDETKAPVEFHEALRLMKEGKIFKYKKDNTCLYRAVINAHDEFSFVCFDPAKKSESYRVVIPGSTVYLANWQEVVKKETVPTVPAVPDVYTVPNVPDVSESSKISVVPLTAEGHRPLKGEWKLILDSLVEDLKATWHKRVNDLRKKQEEAIRMQNKAVQEENK